MNHRMQFSPQLVGLVYKPLGRFSYTITANPHMFNSGQYSNKKNGHKSDCGIVQALPYMRCIGESWPMTRERAYFEAITLKEHGHLCPDHVPDVYHFDRAMSLIGMRYLEPPHIILRKGLIAGIEYPLLAEHISEYMARTLFFTSLLHRTTTEHKRAGYYSSLYLFLVFKILFAFDVRFLSLQNRKKMIWGFIFMFIFS